MASPFVKVGSALVFLVVSWKQGPLVVQTWAPGVTDPPQTFEVLYFGSRAPRVYKHGPLIFVNNRARLTHFAWYLFLWQHAFVGSSVNCSLSVTTWSKLALVRSGFGKDLFGVSGNHRTLVDVNFT